MYREALARVALGERVISTDEMTGVQALERAAPGLPLRPGKVERREFEYIRHGTLSFIINFDVVSGKVIAHQLDLPAPRPTSWPTSAARLRATQTLPSGTLSWTT